MDNLNKLSLQKELEFYSRLLQKHEAIKKEKERSTVEKFSQNSNRRQTSFHGNNVVQMKTQPSISFDKKYSYRKSNNYDICDLNKKTVLYNQNHNFKSKYALAKNQTSKYVSPNSKNIFKSNSVNNNLLYIPKKSIAISKNESDKSLSVSSHKLVQKLPSNKDFIKEIESVTELLKKKSSESQPKELSSVAKFENVALRKPLAHKSSKYSAFNNFNPMKNESAFSKTKNSSRMSLKVMSSNIKSVDSRKPGNCYTKINFKNGNNCSLLKEFNSNKFSLKNVDNKEALNCKATSSFFKTNKNTSQSENKFQKFSSESHSRKITFSGSKSLSNNSSISENTSESSSKVLSSGKQELMIKFTSESALSGSKACAESVNISKVKSQSLLKNKSPSALKSVKVAKLKPIGGRYTKINKHLTTPHKVQQLKLSFHQTPSTKKTRGNLNNKYKIINKIRVPHSRKSTNSFISIKCKENSDIEIESDPFLRDLNDSAIEKIEKNLLAISTALTSTDVSKECDVNNGVFQHSLSNGDTKLHFRKATMKKSKTRISKYKIVNSNVSHNYSLKKRQNFTYQKSGMRKLKQSKFTLINKHIQPVHVITPIRQEKSILVKRIFKSKNVIVNKNASPTSYSAKMIKSKYLTLNKRRSYDLQKHIYPRMPLHHPKFKGSPLVPKHSKLNRYRRTAMSTYHPKVNRKFTQYSYQTSNRQFCRNIQGKKYKRKSNGGYGPYPVLIRGMRYSLNSSGKTLKKLHTKGSTIKSFQRISNKIYIRSPESSLKTLTPVSTNLASRVLHRSINRILTASTKKSLAKVNTYCMFYNRFGRCNRGVKCTYIHDPSKIAVCTRFLRGTCKVDGCPFSHEITPGKMAICSFFLVGACEKVNCPYRHEKLPQDAKLCKAFVQGYCPNGKECKKAHILVCPKYMQSECDKGSSCPFPHPPQKAKKNVQKEAEVEERKTSDDFFENYLRYFQQGEECTENKYDENNPANSCVPKKRKLEEQPSFIPL